jgi:hypothetical protein
MGQSMPQARNRDGLGPILVRPIIHTWILRDVFLSHLKPA